jgi:integrase
MPRQAKLSKKNGHWYTKAGNPNGVYFGKIGDVTYQEAKEKFADYLKVVAPARLARVVASISTGQLVDLFLDWVEAHRSDRTYDERKRHLERFINFSRNVPGKRGRPLRARRPEEYRPVGENPYAGFEEVLRVYWHTGARTGELAACTASDFVRSARQIVLGRHKRAKTMKDAIPRRITLNGEAFSILEKWCRSKRGDEPIFTDPKGRGWTRMRLDERFVKVRKRAGVRDDITIYSFRHLWISEMLMSGVDVATVAKMAGTSIAMIEKVYGHFTNQHFVDAQSRLDTARQTRAEAASGQVPSNMAHSTAA